jgi:DNA repair protein SbcC/Rad50
MNLMLVERGMRIMTDIRLHKISVDHFRGYRQQAVFNVNNTDLLILSGPNGMGKTSFFDSIEWGFTGKLFRFEDPNEEKGKSHFINFQPYESPAKVQIEFGDGKNNYTLTRKVTNFIGRDTDYGLNKSKLTIYREDVGLVEGDAANILLNDIMLKNEWKDKVNFKDVFSQYHVLTQDKLKSFVNGLKGPERYNQISSIIGTHRFLKYGSEFSLIRREIESKIEKIENQVELVKVEINTLEENVSESGVNIGNQKNLATYVEQIVKENNIVVEDKVNITSQNDIKYYINTLLEKILSTKKQLEQSISIYDNQQTDLNRIIKNKGEYYLNIKEYGKLTKFIPLAQKARRLSYLSENLSSFITYTNKNQELKDNLRDVLNKQQSNDKEIEFINNIRNLLSGLVNSLTKVSERYPKLKEKGISLLALLGNWRDIVNNYDQTIGEYNNSNKDMSFIKPLGLYLKRIEDRLDDIVNNIQNCREEKNNNQTLLVKLTTELNSLSTQDEKQKEVLNAAREFLKEKFNNNIQVDKCPVCSTNQDYNELLTKIEMQLEIENVLIINKIQEIDELKKQINQLDDTIKNFLHKEDECLDELLNIFKTPLSQLENTLNHLYFYQKEYSNQVLEIKNRISAIDVTQKELTNIVSQDLSINNSNFSNIEEILQSELKKLISSLEHFNLDIFNSNLNDLERKASLLKDKITNFEIYLSDKQINKLEIESSLESSIRKINIEKDKKVNLLLNYNFVEKELLKVSSQIENDNNFIKISNLRKQLKSMEKELDDLFLVKNRLSKLHKAVDSVVSKMNQDVLSENEQFVNSIFNRIYPHPFYRNISFELESNRSNNKILTLRVNREHDGKDINPAYTFSSAQINVVAISIFLAMSLRQQCTNLKTILLDDPIQSMDDLNIFSFIDILRGFASEGVFEDLKKQFILSTHDEKIYRLMKKKFRFINNKSISFKEYNHFGPKYIIK